MRFFSLPGHSTEITPPDMDDIETSQAGGNAIRGVQVGALRVQSLHKIDDRTASFVIKKN